MSNSYDRIPDSGILMQCVGSGPSHLLTVNMEFSTLKYGCENSSIHSVALCLLR